MPTPSIIGNMSLLGVSFVLGIANYRGELLYLGKGTTRRPRDLTASTNVWDHLCLDIDKNFSSYHGKMFFAFYLGVNSKVGGMVLPWFRWQSLRNLVGSFISLASSTLYYTLSFWSTRRGKVNYESDAR